MPKQPKDKSAHLQELEAVFERHTRRFSPFDVLGLRTSEQDTADPPPREAQDENASTHRGVDDTHPHDMPIHMGEGDTPLSEEGIHPRVVELPDLSSTSTANNASTHRGVDDTHPHSKYKEQLSSAYTDVPMHDILVATQLRAQLGKKARQVLAYLNSIRSIERPAYTMPVGYGQISATTDVHPHYLRRNVLPKLAMIGLIGIVHKSFQGTIYHLHYDVAFIQIVVGEDEEPVLPAFSEAPLSTHQLRPLPPETVAALPSWVDREYWGWLTSEIVHQLVNKAGTDIQAQEKLDIIVYNETHGPVERRVRDRRAVLAHYLRIPQADIWPNDDGFETLALRHARQERDRALQEKTLAEEALRARQEAAKARFLASLTDAQLQWLKLEAKRRVDTRPEARFLTSRYLLYKAEEEQLFQEWMDRGRYGESVPHGASGGSDRTEDAR
jgi:hypothetical protein